MDANLVSSSNSRVRAFCIEETDSYTRRKGELGREESKRERGRESREEKGEKRE